MKTLTEQVVAQSTKPFFTRNELEQWVEGSANRRDALLRRALAAGEIARIRRGLYMLCFPYQKKKPNPFALAQHLYGLSYISFESALAFHGWIPEAVYTVASVSLNRSRTFETPVGRFGFVRVPQRCFYVGVERVESGNGNEPVLVAHPIKALADLVYVRRSDEPLADFFGSLRIDAGMLESVEAGWVDELIGNYSGLRVKRFLQQVRERVDK